METHEIFLHRAEETAMIFGSYRGGAEFALPQHTLFADKNSAYREEVI
jgi:hypothetical protein